MDKFNAAALTGEKPDESGGNFAAGAIGPVNGILSILYINTPVPRVNLPLSSLKSPFTGRCGNRIDNITTKYNKSKRFFVKKCKNLLKYGNSPARGERNNRRTWMEAGMERPDKCRNDAPRRKAGSWVFDPASNKDNVEGPIAPVTSLPQSAA
jgi:hypothetical protein